MKEKLLRFLRLISVSPKRFPVEFALGLTFFLIAAYGHAFSHWDSELHATVCRLSDAALPFFFPLVVLTYCLGRVNRSAYIVSYFLILPLMNVGFLPPLSGYAYVCTYLIALVMLIAGVKRMDNSTFSASVLNTALQAFTGLCLAGLLNLAIYAVCFSFFFIFDLQAPNYFYTYIADFVWYVVAPQFCFTLISENENVLKEPAKVLQFIYNYIISPALVVYAFIMYVYFIKITIEWELPKGGVAWLVTVFTLLSLGCVMLQDIMPKRHYNWFYGNFTWIGLPPLIMFWVGSIHRVSQYGFTEDRVYLLVAGVLITLFTLMLAHRLTRRYQLMAVIAACMMAVFTFLPYISASSIGLRSQQNRLRNLMTELGVADSASGKFIDSVDVRRINADSVLCMRYRDLSDVERYVRMDMNDYSFEQEYGKWNYSTYSFNYLPDSISEPTRECERDFPLQLGEYTILLPDAYSLRYSDGVITIRTKTGGDKVLEYPIAEYVKENPGYINDPTELFTYANDSLMLVLSSIDLGFREVRYVNEYNFSLYRKAVNTEDEVEPLER